MTKTQLKAFAIWFLFPYLFLVAFEIVFELVAQWPHVTASAMFHFFYWKTITFCAIEAMIGIAILWLLPIAQRWVEILTGVGLSIVLMVATVIVEVGLFGGFEENVDIFVTAFILAIPSCLASGYAGYLRSRDGK